MSGAPETVIGRWFNPLNLDLIQIIVPGGPVIWRFNQTFALWFAGSGNPTSLYGQLDGNLYIDISSGNIWQLQTGIWVQVSGGGGGSAHIYATSFVGQTSFTISGATHNLGTADLLVVIYDSSTGIRTQIYPDSIQVNSSTFDVTVNFVQAQSGRVVITG